MATRRQAREWAFQIVFQLDMNPAELDKVLELFWVDKKVDVRTRKFTETLVRGVLEHTKEIDTKIVEYAKNWDLHRMGNVERNVMRVAMQEIMYSDDVPPVVAINEAVDIVKYFGTTEAGKFVNGILDQARKSIPKRTPPSKTAKA